MRLQLTRSGASLCVAVVALWLQAGSTECRAEQTNGNGAGARQETQPAPSPSSRRRPASVVGTLAIAVPDTDAASSPPAGRGPELSPRTPIALQRGPSGAVLELNPPDTNARPVGGQDPARVEGVAGSEPKQGRLGIDLVPGIRIQDVRLSVAKRNVQEVTYAGYAASLMLKGRTTPYILWPSNAAGPDSQYSLGGGIGIEVQAPTRFTINESVSGGKGDLSTDRGMASETISYVAAYLESLGRQGCLFISTCGGGVGLGVARIGVEGTARFIVGSGYTFNTAANVPIAYLYADEYPDRIPLQLRVAIVVLGPFEARGIKYGLGSEVLIDVGYQFRL